MIVKKTLHVSKEAYFNLLQRYLLNDLKKSVNKAIKLSDLKAGYRFEKKYRMKQGEDFISQQEIIEMEYPTAYCLRFSIPNGYQKIAHHIHELSEDSIEVSYEEVIETNNAVLKFAQLSRRRKARKLMQQLLTNLELEIIAK